MEQQQQQHMMTREEAETIAAAEGLTLIEANNKSGFKNVTLGPHCSERPPPKNDYDRRRCKWTAPFYQMRTSVGGRSVLVKFASKFEAALAYALSPDGRRAAEMLKQKSKAPMTEAEVLKIAEEEGLELVRSAAATGFKNGAHQCGVATAPIRGQQLRQWGSMTQLGAFATATEAALVARHTRDSLRHAKRRSEPARRRPRRRPRRTEGARAAKFLARCEAMVVRGDRPDVILQPPRLRRRRVRRQDPIWSGLRQATSGEAAARVAPPPPRHDAARSVSRCSTRALPRRTARRGARHRAATTSTWSACVIGVSNAEARRAPSAAALSPPPAACSSSFLTKP